MSGLLLRRPAILSVSLLSGVALLLAGQAMLRSIANSPTFLVKELEARWLLQPVPGALRTGTDAPTGSRTLTQVWRYRLNPPISIFQVDLHRVAQALKGRHPTAQVEVVRRVLPNRLVAFLRPAHLVAQLKADRYYPVSEEGTLLTEGQAAPFPHFPILFVENLTGPYRAGTRFKSSSLLSSCELLAQIRRQGGVAGHGVGSLRVQKGTMTLFLDSGLEIRLNPSHLFSSWQRFMELVIEKPHLLKDSRYVDLRFEDPAIGSRQIARALR